MEAVLRNRTKYPHLIVPCFEPEDVMGSPRIQEDVEFLLSEKEYGSISETEVEHFEDNDEILEEYEEFWEDWFKNEFCVTFEERLVQHFKGWCDHLLFYEFYLAKYVQEERKIYFREFRKIQAEYKYENINENLPVLAEDEFSTTFGNFFYKGCEFHGLNRIEVIDELLFQVLFFFSIDDENFIQGEIDGFLDKVSRVLDESDGG